MDTTELRYHAPYLEWAKRRPTPRFDLAGSNVRACTIDDIEGARNALQLTGHNDNGYAPLVDAIAARYGPTRDQVTTANGTSGANFQTFAALLEPGDEVLVERPGYDPLLGAPRLLGATVGRFERRFEDGYALDPDRVSRAMTTRTKLIVVTTPHNPSGIVATRESLMAIGRLAERAGARVLVDEVYLDAADPECKPAALLGDVFISTSSLTKSYGLAGLRCGWTISSSDVAERIRRARDVIDGTGSIVAERLATLAFAQLPRLAARAAALIAANTSLVRAFLDGQERLELARPRLSTVLFPKLRGVDDTSAFAQRLLEERQTAVVPGYFFEAPAHFRIGLGASTDIVRGGLEQLAAALAEPIR
ncbi:MAG TPA: pyridoxal phosphate-dependent aminotransferase [Vicinamibacterales bacterium]|nr:pyridoxal phosphate-dependent aminotransferase [Vicinamibacterales bacterium]